MTDTSFETGGAPAPQDRPEATARHVARLEAENAALRRALADTLAKAERAAVRHGTELASEGRRRADEAVAARRATGEAEARHGREMAASRGDLSAAEERNAALARAHDALAESRAALREREERLRLVLDSASDYAIFTTDLDRRVTSWNAGAERLTGWAEAEILGRSADAIFVPEDRAAGAPEQEAEGALRDGRAANERWHERKDGTRFWGSGLVMPLRCPEAGPEAPPLGLLKVMRDRTERRRAEEALRGRERRLRLLADTAAGLLAAADPDEVLGPLFRSLEEEFGIDISFSYAVDGDGRGLQLASCLGVPEEHRAGFARLALGEAVCGAAAQARRAVHVPDVLASEDPAAAALRRMGVRAYVAFPLVAGGRLLGTVSFGSRTRADFSGEELAFFGAVAHCAAVVRERLQAEEALRDSEARWRGLFERMHEGFALCEVVRDAEGRATNYRYLEVNPAWERLTGLPAEAAVGRLATEANPGIEPVWIETFARAAETGEAARIEHRAAGLGGRWFDAMAYRTGPGRFALLFLNVTERKAAEARRDALVELGDRLRDLRDPGAIAHAAAEVIGRALGAPRAGYGTVDAAGEIFRVARDWTDGRAASIAGEWRVADYWADLAAEHGRGGVVAVEDVERDPRTAARAGAYTAAGVRAFLDMPVVEAGRVAAILYVHAAAPRAWDAEEAAFVRGVADRAWAAAERARAEEGLRAANEALRAGEARLRLALEAGRLGAWELDVATDTATRSPRHDAIFGYAEPPPGWGFEPFMRHVLPEDRAHVERTFRAAVEGGADWHFECRIRRPDDGAARWIEARGQPVRDAAGRPVRLLGVVQDITERKRAEERRALLLAELNHRVKNTLAVVQSLALQTARGAADLPSFSKAFQARLAALARAHDLLTRESWEGAALYDAVRAALDTGIAGRVDFACGCGGPGAAPLLTPAQALAVAMALHELGTNALKHGALSVPGGRVSVRCGTEPGSGARVVEWLERGGPPVAAPPARRGFGLRLLERGLAVQAGMRADLRFEAEGLRCTLRLPPPPARQADGASVA